MRHRGAAVELRRLEDGVDGGIRIAMHDAQRVTRFIEVSEAGEREFHVTHFAQRLAADDALVGQHFGGGGLRAGQLGNRGRLRGGSGEGGRRGRATGGRELVFDFTHTRQGVVGPGLRQFLEIHVAVDARQQAFGAELGQALIDHAAGFAEFRVAGVAQRQHGILQLGQLRRALGTEEFVESPRFIRRIAVAMRADDDVQQLLFRDLARLVIARLDHAGLHAERLHGGQQLLGNLAAVAGVRGRENS